MGGRGVNRKISLAATAAALVAAAALLWASPAGAEQRSLLTPEGTLYTVQAGLYSALEPNGNLARPSDYVIQWTSLPQSGPGQAGIIPGTATSDYKANFDLAYDSFSHSLFLVWNDRVSLFNSVRFAVLQNGIWTQSQLLPSSVFTFASNPRILITHQVIQTTNNSGNEVDYTRSIVSIVWWEDSIRPRARYAPIFIEHDGIDLSDVQIYDLPDLIGSPAAVSSPNFGNPVYTNPALQADGLTSTILATFADAGAGKLQTILLNFPTDLRGAPNPTTPEGRGHVIVIFNHHTRPLPGTLPGNPFRVGTIIGSDYNPTFYWQNDDSAILFSRFDGQFWSDPRTVPLTPSLDAEKAISLIRDMSLQN